MFLKRRYLRVTFCNLLSAVSFQFYTETASNYYNVDIIYTAFKKITIAIQPKLDAK